MRHLFTALTTALLLWNGLALASSNIETLHKFCQDKKTCSDGLAPRSDLVMTDRNSLTLYGTTTGGGARGNAGTVFRFNYNTKESTWVYELLHSFGTTKWDGAAPSGAMVVRHGDVYGTTYYGGMCGSGTIWSYVDKQFTTQIYLCGNSKWGLYGEGVYSTNGDWPLYPVTKAGGIYGGGTVMQWKSPGAFKIYHAFGKDQITGGPISNHFDRAGKLTSLMKYGQPSLTTVSVKGKEHLRFAFEKGTEPMDFKVADDGYLYGVNQVGGLQDKGILWRWSSKAGFTVLYNFCSLSDCTDGQFPFTAPLKIGDQLYGTVAAGGGHDHDPYGYGAGIIYRFSLADNTLTVLHAFNNHDGQYVFQGLTKGIDGKLYGVTSGPGGVGSFPGTIFRLSVPH